MSTKTRSRKRKQSSASSDQCSRDESEIRNEVEPEVIIIDDEDSKSADDFDQEFAEDSMSDSVLIGAVERIESSQSLSSPFMYSNNNRKKIHMDILDCKEHASSEAGAQALSNPANVTKSSRDPNRGLYPRPPRKDFSLSGSFVPASALHTVKRPSADNSCTSSAGNVSHLQTYNSGPKKRHAGPKFPNQTNSLYKYFSSSQPANSSHPKPNSTPSKTVSSSQGRTSASPPLPKSSTVMYSPIKLVAGSSLYTIASAAESESSGKTRSGVSKNLFSGQRSQTVPKKTTRSKKPPPNFNRDNSFLYSNDPLPKPTAAKPKDLYGLLGNGNLLPDDPEGNLSGIHINDFPREILENILCRLPIMDLCLNVNRVCILWRDMIANERFVPWKKLYHKVKLGQESSLDYVQSIMDKNGMHDKESYLINLVRYMKNFKPVTAHNMCDCLKGHDMYKTARSLMEERLQDCIKNGNPNPWSMVSVLVILSEYVRDVEAIFTALLSSQCLAVEITECLYAIATFLLMFRNVKYSEVWTGMHYRVFYALYLFENESSTTTSQLKTAHQHNRSGQQSIMKYGTGDSDVQMTHEQMRICNHNVGENQTIKIVAFAGTGKTTTLVRYTKLRPSIKFLLLVYNRSVKDHAETKFPHNVKCMTGHGIAYQKVGRRYAAAGKLGSNIRVPDVLDVMTAIKGESLYVQAKHVITTINNYMASADEEITPTAHSPKVHMDDKTGRKKDIPYNMQKHYAEEAQKVWERIIDVNDKKMKLPHDAYVKLYQLSKPRIYGYGVLLIDEAQDITPVMADVIERQSMPKIMVGDPHQQIYSFRGAVNAMQGVNASHVFYLTQSFRFGPEIAHVASCCLELLKNERRKTLVGNGKPGSIRGEKQGQVAVIARSNFQVFAEAVKQCCFSDRDVKVGFVGGMDGFGFPMIMDIYTLMLPPDERAKEGREIQNYLIKKFSSLGELEKFATKTMDNELLGKIKIVKTYNTAIPSHISKIRSKAVRDNDVADILFSTAHKAKGLEFSTVRVTDDFSAVMPTEAAVLGVGINPGMQTADESNLLYVAVTRAKKCLQMSPTIYRLLRNCGENFRYPVSSELLRSQGVTMTCSETERNFDPLTCTIVRRSLKLGDNEEKAQLVYCPQWVTEDMTSLRQLFGSLEDERSKPENIGRRRLQAMDVEYYMGHDEEDEDGELFFFDAPHQIFPYVV